MYNAFIIPHFYYCSTVWYDGSKNKLTKMSKLQKKAARIITGDCYDIRSNEVFQKLNWLPMNTHLQIRENIATFKALLEIRLRILPIHLIVVRMKHTI